jgi:hypothetical protein
LFDCGFLFGEKLFALCTVSFRFADLVLHHFLAFLHDAEQRTKCVTVQEEIQNDKRNRRDHQGFPMDRHVTANSLQRLVLAKTQFLQNEGVDGFGLPRQTETI